jgi:MFS family permease
MLFGAAGLAVLYVIVARLLVAQSPYVSWFLLGAIGVYAMSLAPVTWVLISEIFPNRVRGQATSVAVTGLWAAYFVLVFTFPVLFKHYQEKSFYLYAAVCLLGLLFVFFKVKETKGRTLEQLEDMLK